MFFDVFVKCCHKGFGFAVRNCVKVIQVLYSILVAVTEISYEFVDVIGDNLFSVFFAIALQVQQLGYFVCFITLWSNFVAVFENNVFVCK